jgi:signal transduction histidine kinase
MKIIFWLKFLILFSSFQAFSGEKMKIKYGYFVDKNSVLTLEKVKTKEFKKIKEGEDINIGYNENVAVWCKVEIQHNFEKKFIYIDFPNVHLDTIEFFDNENKQILGDKTKFKSLFFQSNTFKIKLAQQHPKTIYFRVKKSISFFNFSLNIRNLNALESDTFNSIFSTAILLGIGFILFIFNLLIFIFTKNRINLYYLFYSVVTIIYVLITTGFLKHFFMPNFLYVSELRIYSGSLWFLVLSLFISELLNLRNQQNNYFQWIKKLGIINLSLMIFSFLLLISGLESYLRYFMIAAYLNFATILFLLVYVTIKNYKIQKNTVNYILIAFLPNFIWIIILILKAFKLIPKEANTEWLVYLNIYEISLFGYILIKSYLQTFQINNSLKMEIISEKEKAGEYISNIQIKERQQISNIIHDKFGSQLAHISNLASLKKDKLLLNNIQELASELRLVSHQILPKSLESGALLASLKTHAESLCQGQENLMIFIDSYDFPEKINEKWTFDVFLISNELIHNTMKHGKSSEIVIEIFGYDEEYIFQFSDNGKGFDPTTFTKGFGLTNIENRILNNGGTFEINSKLGEGTVIQISLPKH